MTNSNDHPVTGTGPPGLASPAEERTAVVSRSQRSASTFPLTDGMPLHGAGAGETDAGSHRRWLWWLSGYALAACLSLYFVGALEVFDFASIGAEVRLNRRRSAGRSRASVRLPISTSDGWKS